MPDRFAAGELVRTRNLDPSGHTRLPRYARGAVGEIIECAGHHPLADERARGVQGRPQPVYHVRFEAVVLFGAGDHAVTVELWEDYLEPTTTHQRDTGA